jgi:uncharacterized protein
MRCPTCHKVFDGASSQAIPFCSPRCRQIDTNRWLSEEQRVPANSLDEESPEDDGRPPEEDEESPDLLAEDEGQASHQEEDSRGE